LFNVEFLVDKGTELGHWVQRDSSTVKLAPNVGLEASKGPMGGQQGQESNLRSSNQRSFWT